VQKFNTAIFAKYT